MTHCFGQLGPGWLAGNLDPMSEEPVPTRTPDMDKMMLAGCSSFVAASFLSYFLWVWPFFVSGELFEFAVVQKNLLLGGGASLLPGILFIRKGGLAGACGFIAGTAAFGVFFFLRVDQFFWGLRLERMPQPDYDLSIKYLAPLACIAFSVLVSALLLDRKHT